MDSVSAVADSLRLQLNLGDAVTDAERVSLAKIGAIQGRIGTRLAIARAWMDVGNPQAATQHTAASSLLLDSLFAISSAIIAAEDSRATGMLAKADRIVTRQQVLVQSLLAVGLLAALIVGFATLRAVTKPLDMLAAGARRVGEGNLQIAIDPTGLDEEYRVVAQALADTTIRLSQLVREIQNEARDVASAAGALTVASGAAAESTNRVSESMLHIASAAHEQRGAVETTHSVLAHVRAASSVLESTAADAGALEGEVRQLTDGARLGIGEALDALGARPRRHRRLARERRTRREGIGHRPGVPADHPADLRTDGSPRAQRGHRSGTGRRKRTRIRRRRRRGPQARGPQQSHGGRRCAR
jgi:methyl-accepting chemotaxis protein